jgi:hypothetical protein
MGFGFGYRPQSTPFSFTRKLLLSHSWHSQATKGRLLIVCSSQDGESKGGVTNFRIFATPPLVVLWLDGSQRDCLKIYSKHLEKFFGKILDNL